MPRSVTATMADTMACRSLPSLAPMRTVYTSPASSFTADSDATVETGDVYALRIGASDGKERHAIVSAMVAVTDRGNEVLWSAA